MSSAACSARLAVRGLVRCLALTLCAAAAAHAAPSVPAARGLIVQLRDAPTHASMVLERRERAAALSARSESPLATRESARWQRVLAAEPSMRIASRRAHSASAQVLRFEQALTDEQAQALAARLAAQPEVAWAVPDTRERRLQVGSAPSDPYFSQQWWLQPASGSDQVPPAQRLRGVPGFLTAWTQRSVGSASSHVAVLDSGILAAHPELAGRVLPGYDMVADSAYSNDGDGRDADPSDPGDWVDEADRTRDPANYGSCALQSSSWHGTAIAGMLFGNTDNNAGTAAMNWQGRVLPVRVAAKCGADVSDIVDGMRWAAGLDVCKRSDSAGNCVEMAPRNANPVKVVNISFGGTGACDPYQGAINELRNLGVVVVAAAGNEWTAPTRPAKCTGVVGVAALNRDGFKSNYSNFGSELAASGIATVGGDDADGAWASLADSGLLSIGNDGSTAPGAYGYYHYFGTSFAAPVVAGAVSLMLSVKPDLTHAQIVDGLRRSARPHVTSDVPGVANCSTSNPGRCLCTTQTCGAGILDVAQALAYAANPGAYTAPNWPAVSLDNAELRAAAATGPDRPADSSSGSGSSSGGGGGAASPLWLAGLLLVVVALWRLRRSA
jgi:serine protease